MALSRSKGPLLRRVPEPGLPVTINDQPLYNSKIINTFVQLLEKKYPQVNVRELLQHAEITPYELSDEGHWLTQHQVDRFHARMAQLVGEDISREGGRYASV